GKWNDGVQISGKGVVVKQKGGDPSIPAALRGEYRLHIGIKTEIEAGELLRSSLTEAEQADADGGQQQKANDRSHPFFGRGPAGYGQEHSGIGEQLGQRL